jgi:cytochrome c556
MKTAWLPAFVLLAACNHEQDKFRYSTAHQDEERVAAMYSMRTIGVELVTMFEDKNVEPSPIRELTGRLAQQADDLSRHFEYAPDPKRRQTSASKALIWDESGDFQTAMASFQQKTRRLETIVNTMLDSKLESIWPALVDTGDSCTACHQKFRIGGDPSHD